MAAITQAGQPGRILPSSPPRPARVPLIGPGQHGQCYCPDWHKGIIQIDCLISFHFTDEDTGFPQKFGILSKAMQLKGLESGVLSPRLVQISSSHPHQPPKKSAWLPRGRTKMNCELLKTLLFTTPDQHVRFPGAHPSIYGWGCSVRLQDTDFSSTRGRRGINNNWGRGRDITKMATPPCQYPLEANT